eukprot:gnl/Trimastix_PCT/1320.p1 GENE.gnl/Trimastix_PCT/1320~~gnl/Trimastix_PCT/1320.p1  ORF type:complete len:861 (-),score=250.87 gnl/Trimastix_PCT/1320:312-2894(-)
MEYCVAIPEKQASISLPFEPTQTVGDLAHEVATRVNIKNPNDYGIYVTFSDDRRPAWLHHSAPLDISSQDRVELRKKMRVLKVQLCEQQKGLLVDETLSVQDNFPLIAKKLDLDGNVDDYSFLVASQENEQWLNPHLTLSENNVRKDTVVLVRKKFFFDDNIETLTPSVATLLQWQMRVAVVRGQFPCSYDDAIFLAALQLQIQLGDFNPRAHTTTIIQPNDLLPPQWRRQKFVADDIMRLFKRLLGTTDLQAKTKYLKRCQSLRGYGITYFPVRTKPRGSKRFTQQQLLGIAREGVLVADCESKEPTAKYPFGSIKRWGTGSSVFLMDLEDEQILFQTNDGEMIAQFLVDIVEYIQRHDGLHPGPTTSSSIPAAPPLPAPGSIPAAPPLPAPGSIPAAPPLPPPGSVPKAPAVPSAPAAAPPSAGAGSAPRGRACGSMSLADELATAAAKRTASGANEAAAARDEQPSSSSSGGGMMASISAAAVRMRKQRERADAERREQEAAEAEKKKADVTAKAVDSDGEDSDDDWDKEDTPKQETMQAKRLLSRQLSQLHQEQESRRAMSQSPPRAAPSPATRTPSKLAARSVAVTPASVSTAASESTDTAALDQERARANKLASELAQSQQRVRELEASLAALQAEVQKERQDKERAQAELRTLRDDNRRMKQQLFSSSSSSSASGPSSSPASSGAASRFGKTPASPGATSWTKPAASTAATASHAPSASTASHRPAAPSASIPARAGTTTTTGGTNWAKPATASPATRAKTTPASTTSSSSSSSSPSSSGPSASSRFNDWLKKTKGSAASSSSSAPAPAPPAADNAASSSAGAASSATPAQPADAATGNRGGISALRAMFEKK